MARFEIIANKGGPGYLLDVQADLLRGLNTRVVVPLLPKDLAPKPATRLNPTFLLDGTEYVMATQFLAAVPLNVLGTPLHNLSHQDTAITAALDFLFGGI